MTLLIIMVVVLLVMTMFWRGGGFLAGLWLAVIVGWIAANLVSIFHGPALAVWGATEVMRVIGVFIAPVGAVLGYF